MGKNYKSTMMACKGNIVKCLTLLNLLFHNATSEQRYVRQLSPLTGTDQPSTVPSCPQFWEQVGGINADIGGCGLEDCNDRYDKNTIEQCKNHCSQNSSCQSFTWAPLDGDKNHPGKAVCTIYDSDESNQTWGSNQIMCKPVFYLSSEKHNWWQHNDIAIQNGLTLASVHNQDQAEYIRDLTILSGCDRVWLGGSRVDSSADWTWADGSPFDYTYWAPNQPDDWGNNNYENCIEVWTTTKWKWNDKSCWDKYCAIYTRL